MLTLKEHSPQRKHYYYERDSKHSEKVTNKVMLTEHFPQFLYDKHAQNILKSSLKV